MRCIRYMKFEHARKSLRDGLFKVSRISEFNDPSECRVRFVNSGEVPALRKYIRKNFSRLQSECIRRSNANTPESQSLFTETFIYNEMLASYKRHSNVYHVSSFENLILLICFVKERGLKEYADTLFWSHYADSGKGVRITFDLELRPKPGLYYMKDVKYKDEVPAFDLTSFDTWMQGEQFNKYIGESVCTKGSAWSYENEIRMIIPRKHPIKQIGTKHIQKRVVDGEQLEFVVIVLSLIKLVDFGQRVTPEDIHRFITEVSALQDSLHIHFYKTRFKESKYAYDYVRMP